MKNAVIPIVIINILFSTNPGIRITSKAQSRKSPQVIAIEGTGLVEFAPDLVHADVTSPEDRVKSEKLVAILSEFGDGKDVAKNSHISAELRNFILQYPNETEAYVMRAVIEFSAAEPDFSQIFKNLDKAEDLVSKGFTFAGTISKADLYVLRAKAHLLTHRDHDCLSNLETAIQSNPSKSIFNTGGVKPNEKTSNLAAFYESDFQYLASKYPGDFRVFMARGLFYDSFTSYSEDYFAPAFADLKHAATLNHNSALVQYILGALYQETTFLTKAAWRDISDSGGYKDQQNNAALPHLERATAIDPNFVEAWAQQAEALYSLKRYRDAIRRYDQVTRLDPTRGGAFNDRGLAKFYAGQHYDAVEDFTQALTVKENGVNHSSLDLTYQSRADAYVKLNDYPHAISDYGSAIGVHLSSFVILMNLDQLRNLYPELGVLSNADLLEGLRQKYYPNMSSADFAGDLQKSTKSWSSFTLAGLYENRGDAYLASNDIVRALADYRRAHLADSHYTVDRWKPLSQSLSHPMFLDTQTLISSPSGFVTLWVKTIVNTSGAYRQQRFQLDCSSQRIKSLGFVEYGSSGDAKSSSDFEGNWELIVPDSVGEYLAHGACPH